MDEKCFCHFNGYAVKDAYARNRIENFVSVREYGAKGNGEDDDTAALQAALDTGKKVFVPDGVYKITAPIHGTNSIRGDKNTVIRFTPSATYQNAITIKGSRTALCELAACEMGSKSITVPGADFSTLNPGDYVFLLSNEKAAADAREYDLKEETLEVAAAAGSTITFYTVPKWEYAAVTVEKYNFADHVEISNLRVECTKKMEFSSGILLQNCFAASVHDCDAKGFDYAGIYVDHCLHSKIYANYAQVDYRDELQYGIVVSHSYFVSVFGNTINSKRTAIDVTYSSAHVSVNGNAVFGNINTHWAHDVSITGNSIQEGGIEIRGTRIVVEGNNVQSTKSSCLNIDEGGNEGNISIVGNSFKGRFECTIPQSNIKISDNNFMVDSVGSHVFSMRYTTKAKADLMISGNSFQYTGAEENRPEHCIYFGNLNWVANVKIHGNTFKGFRIPLHCKQNAGGNYSQTFIVTDNIIHAFDKGITYRGINDMQIRGNSFIGEGESPVAGIYRLEDSIGAAGIIIKDNYFRDFEYGININDGSAVATKGIVKDNVFVNVTRETVLDGLTLIA